MRVSDCDLRLMRLVSEKLDDEGEAMPNQAAIDRRAKLQAMIEQLGPLSTWSEALAQAAKEGLGSFAKTTHYEIKRGLWPPAGGPKKRQKPAPKAAPASKAPVAAPATNGAVTLPLTGEEAKWAVGIVAATIALAARAGGRDGLRGVLDALDQADGVGG